MTRAWILVDEREWETVAAATGRALKLLTVLDREHTPEETHARARAVRTELDTITRIVGERPPPPLPGLAQPAGDQLELNT